MNLDGEHFGAFLAGAALVFMLWTVSVISSCSDVHVYPYPLENKECVVKWNGAQDHARDEVTRCYPVQPE